MKAVIRRAATWKRTPVLGYAGRKLKPIDRKSDYGYVDRHYETDINTLEELVAFIKANEEDVIIDHDDLDKHLYITIHDDYIE